MANLHETQTSQSAEPAHDEKSTKSRRWLGVGMVFLVLAGAGGLAAHHFLNRGGHNQPVVEYEAPDIDAAAEKEQEAIAQVEVDKQNLKRAQAAFEEAKTNWEQSANTPQADEAKTQLDEAKARLKQAENKLKTAAEIQAEAEAERKKAEELAAKEETYRKGLLGKWTRGDEYGTLTLDLKDDGTGVMTIFFTKGKALLLGTKTLEVDIEWEIAGGDHVIFNSVKGRPEGTFDFISKIRGTRRDQIVTHMEENTFTTHDAGNEAKVKTWKRMNEG